MNTALTTVMAMALSAHAVYHYQHDPSWWMYVPAYGMASMVCILPLPSLTAWRILSSIAVIGGSVLMVFLAWTFHSLEDTAGLELQEAKNLLPWKSHKAFGATALISRGILVKKSVLEFFSEVAIGVALTGSTRLMLDTRANIFKYPRYAILGTILFSSILTTAYSIKYYF